MHVLIGTRVKEVQGSDVTVHCLWCGRREVKAQTRQRTEWLTLFHFIPFLRFRTVFVRCGVCSQT